MKMRKVWLVLVGLATACSSGRDGPTPAVTAVDPPLICNAQAPVTLTLTGSGFSPAVINGLTDTPSVQMPGVSLISDVKTYDSPQAAISLGTPADTTGNKLVVDIPVGVLEPLTPGDAPITYDVRVTNPNDNVGTLADGLTVVPPPLLTAVEPTSGAQGTVVTVTLTGLSFRPDMTVTLDSAPQVVGVNTTVSADGTTATTDFDLTGVAAGTYSITVQNVDGCSSTLENAFTVFVPKIIHLVGIDPPFGCNCSTTTVTITSTGDFVSTPIVEMRPAGMPAAVPFLMSRVAFVDATTLTAVVPAGLTIGLYDVTVRNPPTDGGIGTLENGFLVVDMPVPRVVALTPGRGTTQNNTPVKIFGENFRATVKVELINTSLATAFTMGGITPVSPNEIDLTFPTMTLPVGPYLVRVTDEDQGTYFTFSDFLITNPAGKLSTFAAEPVSLTAARRLLAGTSADDELGLHYVYSIGGDGGAGTAALDTLELSQLARFGELGPWKDIRNHLTVPRVGAAAVSVPIFGPGSPFLPVKTFIYVLGGMDDAGNVLGSIERAVVLSPGQAPIVTDVSGTEGVGTLEAGTWYYKVAAILDVTDADNPGGETLASDEAIVTIGGSGGSISLTWDPVPGAVAYRVYRTDEVNGVSQTEHLIADALADTSYTDDGAPAGFEGFLPNGSVGVWVIQGAAITPRWGLQAVVAFDSGQNYLYAMGGKTAATGGVVDTVENAPFDADGQLGDFGGAPGMTTPRAFFSAALESNANVSSFPTGTSRIWAFNGIDATLMPTGEIEYLDVSGTGRASYSTSRKASGVMAVITNDAFFAMGGATGGTDTTFTNIVSTGRQSQFGPGGDLTNSISSTSSDLLAPRTLGVPVQGAGFIYFIGGSSTGSNALTTTEKSF